MFSRLVSRPKGRGLGFVPLSIACFGSLSLSGCSLIGPPSIGFDRASYNEIIHDTGAEQTLLNILRVRNKENPVFIDVTEVDAAKSLTGSVSGGPSAIGATPNFKSTSAGTISGMVSAVTGTAQVQDAPTIRYQPLLGQALVAQVATPMSASAFQNYLNSSWSTTVLFTLAVNAVTPGYNDFPVAVNAISALDQYGALRSSATSSKKSDETIVPALVLVNSPQPEADSVILYFQPRSTGNCGITASGKAGAQELWTSLKNIYTTPSPRIVRHRRKTPGQDDDNSITLNTKGQPAMPAKRGDVAATPAKPPLLVTRSALDIVRYLTFQDHAFFAPLEEVRQLIRGRKGSSQPCSIEFYFIAKPSANQPVAEQQYLLALKHRYEEGKLRGTTTAWEDDLPAAGVDFNRREALLFTSRKFMLIATSPERPSDAYVSVQYKGEWHSVLEADKISKETLALIHQFNIVQAVPANSPPLTPAITVGGH